MITRPTWEKLTMWRTRQLGVRIVGCNNIIVKFWQRVLRPVSCRIRMHVWGTPSWGILCIHVRAIFKRGIEKKHPSAILVYTYTYTYVYYVTVWINNAIVKIALMRRELWHSHSNEFQATAPENMQHIRNIRSNRPYRNDYELRQFSVLSNDL